MGEPTVSAEVEEAITHLDTYGYCILEGRISGEVADSMRARFLEMHADPELKDQIKGDE
mgnify:FL=1